MVLFSFSAFIIALRETMEAALIVSIVLAYLTKTGNLRFKKHVWVGVFTAIIASVFAAIAFQTLAGGFSGNAEKIFEGFAFTLTAVFLTLMIIWMKKQGRYLEVVLQDKVNVAIDEKSGYSIFLLIFINVFREGIETVLFFVGIGVNEEPSTVFISGSIGIVVTTAFSILLFRGTIKLDLKNFFNYTSIILILFAAGLFAHGMHEFQELETIFGPMGVGVNTVFLDLSSVLNDKENILGVMLRALFGYQDKPTYLELIAYLGYWLMILLVFMRISKPVPQNKAVPA